VLAEQFTGGACGLRGGVEIRIHEVGDGGKSADSPQKKWEEK
jgi:hypothetical protein